MWIWAQPHGYLLFIFIYKPLIWFSASHLPCSLVIKTRFSKIKKTNILTTFLVFLEENSYSFNFLLYLVLAVTKLEDEEWKEVKRKKPATPKQTSGFENTDQEELDFKFDEELETQGIKPSLSSKYWWEFEHKYQLWYILSTLLFSGMIRL